MISRTVTNLAAMMLCLAMWGGAMPASAQVMTDYQAVPPFVSDVVPPNILLLLDNSGSMESRACDSTWCGVLSTGGTTPVTQSFVATSTYSGYFQPNGCYTYDATNTRFDLATTRSLVSVTCASTQWDGNFLNWATFRRFDALKKSMAGGDCIVTRNPDGTCPATGSPARITITAQAIFNVGSGHEITASVSSATYAGRVPTSATPGTPAQIWIMPRGSNNGLQGGFCVDNDNSQPGSSATSCGDTDGFAESYYRLRISQATEPTGVVQQIGAKARFGLFEFKSNSEGARVLVGLGARQSVDWSGSSVETFNTNMAAILDGIGESFPSTWTPLSESLYESARYLAQINSTMSGNTAYIYPIAFSGGNSNAVAFGGTGIGSIGANELSVLTGTETCPSGYIVNACGRDPYFYGSNHTPPWASSSTVVSCCKTFVIIVTDGEPTNDTNVPSSLQDYAHGRHGVHCTGTSGTIHTPNGTCNSNPATPSLTLLGEHKTDYASSGNHYLDDVAYWMHTNDLRPDNGGATPCGGSTPRIAVINEAGRCLPGIQSASIYTFFAFGNINGRELLMHAAQLGGFEDSNGNNLPDLTSEWDKVNNATGTAGSTVPGCNADCIPDTYFESSNVDDLQDRLLAAITSILRKSAAGSSVSVLASSLAGDGALYQAYFYVSEVGTGGSDVRWLGFTEGIFVDRYGNLREDTVQDGRLVLEDDMLIVMRYQDNAALPKFGKVLVNKFKDLNADGVADSATPDVADAELKDIVPIWEAGKRLAANPSTARNIITWVDADNDGLVSTSEQMPFSAANASVLDPYLRAAASGTFTATNIVNFIRGDEIAGMRTRMMDVDTGGTLTPMVWKYGDPIHSPPVLVGAPKSGYHSLYGDASYLAYFQQYVNRRQVIYVGANDGMLHAFNAGYYTPGDDPSTTSKKEYGWFANNPPSVPAPPTPHKNYQLGEEMWGFVPYQLLPQLKWLTQADYSHVYYVDLKPTIADVRIFDPSDPSHPGGWGTILIGGFRMGGSCGQCVSSTGAPPMTVNIGGTNRTFYSAYFVLDITNPEQDPKLLWSFSDPGLGLTTAVPTVVRTSPKADPNTDPTHEKWYMVVGSGPNGYKADHSTGSQTSKLYAIDLKAGPGTNNALVSSMPVGSLTAFMAEAVALDRDLDFRTDMVYVGRALKTGTTTWNGKMYRLRIGDCTGTCSPSNWGVSQGGGRVPAEMLYSFRDAGGVTRVAGPITTAPALSIDDAAKVWVFFGTGRYLNEADKVSTSAQYFFGIKDSVFESPYPSGCDPSTMTQTSCFDDDLVDTTNAVLCTVCASGTSNQVTGVAGATDFQSMIGLVQSKRGWFTKLTTVGERVIVNPTVFGGAIFFPTFTPTNDICAATGSSNLYGLYYRTGTASKDPILGTSASGSTTISNRSVSTGAGILSSVVVQNVAPKPPCNGPGCPPPPPPGCGAAGNTVVWGQGSAGNTAGQGACTKDKLSHYVSWNHQRD